MDEEPVSGNGASEEDDKSIQWSCLGDNDELNNPPAVSMAPLSPEVLQYLSGVREHCSNMLSSVASISGTYRNLLPAMNAMGESLSGISSISKSLPDYTSMVRGMVSALSYLAEVTREVARGVDFKAITVAFRPIALKFKRVKILGRTNWPMYLVDDAGVCNRLDMLSEDTADAELKELVSEIAFDALDENWL